MADTKTHAALVRFNSFRLSLAIYFFVYTYVVAQSLVPLPDEPPRIDFWGVFCVTGGIVLGYHALTSSFRIFQVITWLFLLIAHWQLGKKIKFLEMMLEPKALEAMTQVSLGVILLVMLSPRAFRIFDQKVSAYRRKGPLLTQKGVPF